MKPSRFTSFPGVWTGGVLPPFHSSSCDFACLPMSSNMPACSVGPLGTVASSSYSSSFDSMLVNLPACSAEPLDEIGLLSSPYPPRSANVSRSMRNRFDTCNHNNMSWSQASPAHSSSPGRPCPPTGHNICNHGTVLVQTGPPFVHASNVANTFMAHKAQDAPWQGGLPGTPLGVMLWGSTGEGPCRRPKGPR